MAYGSPSLLSDRGRAWLSSVEHVPPQQLPAHAEMAAKTGLMPFQDALMIKQMADQISASGKSQGVPPNNVMQEKLAMLSGRPAPQPAPQPPPQMQQSQQMQQTQQPQDPRLQAGLGTIPAPVMDNAQYADGGIVAFAGNEGSHVRPSDKRGFWDQFWDFYAPKETDRASWDKTPAEVMQATGNPANYNAGMGASHPEWANNPNGVGVDANGRPYPITPTTEGAWRVPGPDSIPVGTGGFGGLGGIKSSLKPIDVEAEMAKDDYSAYDKWARLMEIDPVEAAKQREEDRRQALIAFGAKMAQASRDNNFFGAFGAGAEEFGKTEAESKKERRAAEKESKLARMNLEIGKGAEQRSSRRSIRENAFRREGDIAADQRGLAALGLQVQANQIAEAGRQATLAAERAGLPIKAAQAVGTLSAARVKVLADIRTSPAYMQWLGVFNDKDSEPEEKAQAQQQLAAIESAATADIDMQLKTLYTQGYAGWGVEGVVPQGNE